MGIKRLNALAAILFLALVFSFKAYCLSLPAFADEINYLRGALEVYKNNLNPFVNYWAYKPPLLFLFVGLLYKMFGYSLIISRLAVFFFSSLALYFTFLVGKKIYNTEIGLFASLLLFFSPFFFAQSGLFYADMPIVMLTISTVFFFLQNDKLKYIISAGFLVLTKETGLLIIISIGIYRFFLALPLLFKSSAGDSFLYRIRGLILEELFLLSPLLFFFSWMLLNRLLLGWFLWPVWSSLIKDFAVDFNFIKYSLRCSFWTEYRFIFVLSIAASVLSFLLFRRRTGPQPIKKELLLFLVISIVGIVGLGGLRNEYGYGFSPRYLLFIQPLFFIAGTACIVHLFRNRICYMIILAVMATFFIHSWTSATYHHELSLEYSNVVKADKATTEFLEKRFPSAEIITSWPISDYLTNTALGYVQTPFRYVSIGLPAATQIKKGVLIVSSKFFASWSKEGIDLLVLVQSKAPRLLARFVSGVEEISVYSF